MTSNELPTINSLKHAELHDLTRLSPTYLAIINHRHKCPKWAREFCLDCFGGGITQVYENLLSEFKQRSKREVFLVRAKHWQKELKYFEARNKGEKTVHPVIYANYRYLQGRLEECKELGGLTKEELYEYEYNCEQCSGKRICPVPKYDCPNKKSDEEVKQ